MICFAGSDGDFHDVEVAYEVMNNGSNLLNRENTQTIVEQKVQRRIVFVRHNLATHSGLGLSSRREPRFGNPNLIPSDHGIIL